MYVLVFLQISQITFFGGGGVKRAAYPPLQHLSIMYVRVFVIAVAII